MRVEVAEDRGPWFPWALVTADDWTVTCVAAGLEPVGAASHDGRWIARAVRP